MNLRLLALSVSLVLVFPTAATANKRGHQAQPSRSPPSYSPPSRPTPPGVRQPRPANDKVKPSLGNPGFRQQPGDSGAASDRRPGLGQSNTSFGSGVKPQVGSGTYGAGGSSGLAHLFNKAGARPPPPSGRSGGLSHLFNKAASGSDVSDRKDDDDNGPPPAPALQPPWRWEPPGF
jgi:hypothetical protein